MPYHNDGMAVMNKRTTFSLDSKTIDRIKHLASHWGVSQAEVVRRAIKRTERGIFEAEENILRKLREYHAEGGIAREEAEDYLKDAYKGRESWRE